MSIRAKRILLLTWGVLIILCGIVTENLMLTGILMFLWALVFANLFGVFFVLIAAAGVNLAAIDVGSPLLCLLIGSVTLSILVFDLASFTLCFSRMRKGTRGAPRLDLQTRKEMLSELKKYEFFHLLVKLMRSQ